MTKNEEALYKFVLDLANDTSSIATSRRFNATEDPSDWYCGNESDAMETGGIIADGYIGDAARDLLTELGLATDLKPLTKTTDT